ARVGAAASVAGPDPAIADLGGVAMAPDGTGGMVFRRYEAGVPHVYAARYDGEAWDVPQRVDVGQRFTSTWPRIGAANDGRLVVTWVQQGPPSQDSLYSAALPRGGSRFLPPTLVDYTIGDSRAAFPSLAMAPGGDAILAYEKVTAFAHPILGAGYVTSQIKLARFDGSRWSGVGVPANRVTTTPLRQPTAASGPKVAIAADGDAVVAWQEPDEQLQDRVWARRVFGSRLGTVLPVSPTALGGAQQRGAADALAVRMTDNGRAIVAFRQQPDPTVRSQPPRVLVAQLDEPESGNGRSFGEARPVGGGGAAPGAPSVGLGGRFGLLTAWEQGGTLRIAQGSQDAAPNVASLGPALAAPAPTATQGVDGRGVVAAATGEGGGRVAVHELDGAAVKATQAVSGPAGGPVTELDVAGAGNGNALVAFAQGEADERQIAVARVDAPPVPFVVESPGDWTNARRPLIAWLPPPNDPRPRHYTVRIDGKIVARRVYARTFRLPTGAVRDGSHTAQIVATSRTGGGDTASPELTFGTDRRRPVATAKVVRRRVRVTVQDPGGTRASGLAEGGTTVDWGDDETTEGRTRSASHAYAKAGRRTVVVRAQDAAGNVSTTRVRLRVPGPRRPSREDH
ncbi:PKD domain-containing protein, partial [Patulibacter sp. S7RM1-6]